MWGGDGGYTEVPGNLANSGTNRRHEHSLDSNTREPTMLLQLQFSSSLILGQNQLQNEVGWGEMSPFFFISGYLNILRDPDPK